LIVRLLGGIGLEEQVPLEPILNLFDREQVTLRASVIRILGRFGGDDRVEKLLIATLGDSEQMVRDAAAAALKQAYPETLRALAPQAISIIQGQKPSVPFDSIAQSFFADTVRYMEYASPAIFERLTQLLNWPYWQVRLKTIRAFGKLRRNIPDEAIRRLYELRHDSQSRAVREAADEVLAEILSLETGIEDD
jgi:HEAT repeat protein